MSGNNFDSKRPKINIFSWLFWNIHRNWVGFDKLTPLSGAKKVVDKYYGKNPRFSRAVDELKSIRQAALSELERGQRLNLMRIFQDETQFQSPIQSRFQSQFQPQHQTQLQPKVVLERLTKHEIDNALNGNFERLEAQNEKKTRKSQTKNESPARIYNLRKR